jgi:hypothetical protein
MSAMSKEWESKVMEDLFSGDEQKVRRAISALQGKPQAMFILPLLSVFFNSNSGELKEELREILNTLKVPYFENEFMNALRNSEWKSHYGQIMAFMWNCGGNPKDHILELIKIGIDGGMETILECYSIIEVMDGPLSEEQLIESQTFLHEQFQKMPDGHPKQIVAMISNLLAEKEIED